MKEHLHNTPHVAEIAYVPELVREFVESCMSQAHGYFTPARRTNAPKVIWEFNNMERFGYYAEYDLDDHIVYIYLPLADDVSTPLEGINNKIKQCIPEISLHERAAFFGPLAKLKQVYGDSDSALWRLYGDYIYTTLTNVLPYKERRRYFHRFEKRAYRLFQPHLRFTDGEKNEYISNIIHEFHHAEFFNRSLEQYNYEYLTNKYIDHNLGIIEEDTCIPESVQNYIDLVDEFDAVTAHQIVTNWYIKKLAMFNTSEVSAFYVRYMIWNSIDEEIAQNVTAVFANKYRSGLRNETMYNGAYSPAHFYPLSKETSVYLRSRIVKRPLSHIGYRLARLYGELFDDGVLDQLIETELTRARHHLV